MNEQLLESLTEQVRENVLFKNYRLEVLGLGDLLVKRAHYRDEITSAEGVLGQKKAALVTSGKIDGKNEQARAAQLAQMLCEDSEAVAAEGKIAELQLSLSGVDIALAVSEKMLAVCHDEARVLAAALQAVGSGERA